LYAGKLTAHRSCGVALAETFGLPHASYQALRKGGLTRLGPCGAIQAGLLVLGEILGDPSPTGAPTPELREAARRYRDAISEKVDFAFDTSCNARTAPRGEFAGETRADYCTSLAGVAAETVAEVLWDLGRGREVSRGG
jgi:hypothetical protein